MDCEGFVNLLFTPLEQILTDICCGARLLFASCEERFGAGGGGGYLGNRIVRYIKNRNTWPCLLLFPASLETVLTVLLSSQVLFWKG